MTEEQQKQEIERDYQKMLEEAPELLQFNEDFQFIIKHVFALGFCAGRLAERDYLKSSFKNN